MKYTGENNKRRLVDLYPIIMIKENLYEQLEDLGAEIEDTLDRLMGDNELYNEYLLKFPKNRNIERLQTAIAAKDYSTAEKEVHTLKGIALNLGFLPLADACMMMLMDFRDGDTESGAAQMPDILEQFNAFKNVIEE